MPGNYVWPESERLAAHLPVVDLANPDRDAVVADIRGACRTHGFFQVLKHGIDNDLQIPEVLAMARKEFADYLPIEEMAKLYSHDPARKIRLSTSFNVRKEKVHNWRDYLRLHCHSLDQFVPDWPSNPPDFKEIMSSCCKKVWELGFRLYAAISKGLGLEPSYMKETLSEQDMDMAVNFYPPCPSPELTYGLPAHTDPNVRIINNGDQLQARYRSVWDRAVENSNNPRLSVASFPYPTPDDAGFLAFHDGQWVAVNPHPGAMIIGLSDLLVQIRVDKSAGARAGDPIPPAGSQ